MFFCLRLVRAHVSRRVSQLSKGSQEKALAALKKDRILLVGLVNSQHAGRQDPMLEKYDSDDEDEGAFVPLLALPPDKRESGPASRALAVLLFLLHA
jgi:hypothetical protein